MKQVSARVWGLVQGVGFRYFVLRHARSLGLKGLVRNLDDGSVEVVAEGQAQALEQLLSRLQQGPPGAKVVRLDIEWSEASGQYRSFEIGY